MRKHRDRLYREMKAAHPDLYEGAIRVGHLALPGFVLGDETARAAEVEAAAMSLAVQAVGLKLRQEL